MVHPEEHIGKNSAPPEWSYSLKAATRSAIEAGGVLSPDGRLHFKHISDGFGFIEPSDLASGVLRVVDKKTGAATVFADADTLLRAGWAVD